MYTQEKSFRSLTVLLAIILGSCALPDGETKGTVNTAPTDDTTTTSDTDPTSTSTSDATTTAGADSEAGTDVVVPMCGNGDVEGDEECDDGNWENDDACLMDCTLAHCGDGFLQDGVESCDDGNYIDDDGCPTTCEFAFCGDGYTQLGIEECDDANTINDDGCDQNCIRARTVFVSSMFFQGTFDGLFGADQKCQALAALADLKRPTQYKAWLSDSAESPAERFHHSPGRYQLLTGVKIADSWEDLTDGTLDNPINITELGELLDDVGVFTNTGISGKGMDPMYSCDNWNAAGLEYKTWTGTNGHTNSEWTDSAIFNPSPCGAYSYLYCFEQ